jgi:type IV secretion system protein VirB11
VTVLAHDVYLDSFLAPLAPYLARSDITDIYVNRPLELWIETADGRIECHEAPGITDRVLDRLARQVAASSAQGISRQHPLLTAALPDGSRIQIIIPPATRGDIALAIRKHAVANLELSDFVDLTKPRHPRANSAASRNGVITTISPEKDWSAILSEGVARRQNILISGGTSSGKTTLLNALLKEIPQNERLILIEDAPEIKMTHLNYVGLVASRSDSGEADVTTEDLLIASLRMRPDRIILGEMRGGEVMTFLRAVNTGHPGSISTIHADSAERAIDQLALLVLQNGTRMSWDDVTGYVKKSIDLIVHLGRSQGGRKIEQILTVS